MAEQDVSCSICKHSPTSRSNPCSGCQLKHSDMSIYGLVKILWCAPSHADVKVEQWSHLHLFLFCLKMNLSQGQPLFSSTFLLTWNSLQRQRNPVTRMTPIPKVPNSHMHKFSLLNQVFGLSQVKPLTSVS